ncbi:class I SAM-dependent methyltransferase [Methanohalophilus sp. RSK]|uniref:class I SAM-dependent methyltransferase n=1 Tax=Methanohalophilus sp. RSK TaxID=2485783 RepID=UPI000F43D662|nr:class I SAM-dependent methyltransferase [Methanohalophilus sp. RSK]RNI15807.1 class I SAM-dependent methyltransferase [Methanohalophilus sp. RSK]
MKCNICACASNFVFKAKILDKYWVDYYFCPNCGFLQTEPPYWLKEAYSQSINSSDTGYMRRNISLSKQVTILLSLFFNSQNGKFVDYAGGYGVFVRLMRYIGFNYYWQDKYTENLFAKGFEWDGEKADALTAFECFEHFEKPLDDLEAMLSISRNIIFTTVLLPDPIPKPTEWWYYGLDHGQHISFYSKKTFVYISEKFGLNYIDLGHTQLLTEKNIPQSAQILLKFHLLGFHKLLGSRLKSKTWSDYLQRSEKL